ncbi:MAG: ATP-grasp domain-containing protein [Dehalogenimonas sp.]
MQIALIYNAPIPSLYDARGESKAESGVLEAVKAVRRSIRALGHNIVEFPLLPPLSSVRKKLSSVNADCVFNLFEGFAGLPRTEAEIADCLEELELPFTGSPSSALLLALDKAATARELSRHGIRTAAQQLLNTETVSGFRLKFPCIVKPRADDASHGLSENSVVFDAGALFQEVKATVDRYDGAPALVEEFLPGREFNVTVFGNSTPEVLPISEIIYTLPHDLPKILTFAAKWEPESSYFQNTNVKCPAGVTPELAADLRSTALAAFNSIGCRGYARVDMRLDPEGNPVVMEVNANPDLSPDAGTVRQAKKSGLSYKGMVSRIIEFALEKA